MMAVSARLAGLVSLLFLVGVTVQAQEPNRSITNVTGDVYRFQNNFHYGLVVVTDSGVVVVDTIDQGASQWLSDNLNTITNQPVTHLVYSHSDADHASGGKVFAGDALVIAQANAPDAIDGVVPDLRFSDEMSMVIGNKTLEFVWLGEGHARDMIAVIVRPENVAFITDVASPTGLPFRDMPGSDIDGWIEQVRKLETLDFAVFAPAHGRIGVKQDARDVRIYMETLRQQVLAGLKAGTSVDDLVTSITLDEYKDWGLYDQWRALNIQGMARYLVASGQVN